MAYTPTTWVNDVTAINATRMNHLEGGVDDVDQALADHLADTTDAHDASAISVLDTGSNFTGSDVEAVLAELQDNIDSVSGGTLSYVKLSDQKTQNTGGGAGSTGSFNTRTLNTEDSDTDGVCSLSANQITLSAGTYECRITVPGWACGRHQARLQNTTGATTLLLGTTAYAASSSTDQTQSFVTGKFTVAASQALEVQQRISAVQGTESLGLACNFTTEIYTVAEFWKVA
jgi:hypothetical protein